MFFPGMTQSHNSRHTTPTAYCAFVHRESIWGENNMGKRECKCSLSPPGKSERITTHQLSLYTRIQKNMHCHSRVPRTKSESHNEVFGNKFQYLLVNTSQTPYECSIP
ncbi:hypothetical protein M9H77_17767 [Catharanthus roseus]|uniref:Uncharacterized protein n=1 Tax=Catharanthus roseus TaxID=4058 RepID=A0ACC0B5L5_CATRO|nr:hypothetical protein M9H77_17767 [Catharanthus roseus]